MNFLLSHALIGIDNSFHEPYASLLKGLVFGLHIQIDPSLKTAIIRSGLAHLVVLSGTNVTLLASLSEKIFFSLGRKMGIILQLLFLGLFTYMVGLQAPLVRALIMFICSVVCYSTGRPSYILWNLFLSIFFIALFWPDWITTISFQLSVLATIGIIISGAIKDRFSIELPFWADVLFESWIVFLVTTPLTVFQFKSISLIGPLSTALASWIVIPIMVGGMFISLLYLLIPSIVLPLASIIYVGLYYLLWIIQTSSTIPFAYFSWK